MLGNAFSFTELQKNFTYFTGHNQTPALCIYENGVHDWLMLGTD
jgi:hypothetical protein